jgi:transposase
MYRYIHPEVKRIILRLCTFYDPNKVSELLGVSVSTVYKVLALWDETGSVVAENQQSMGRKSKLSLSNMTVCF